MVTSGEKKEPEVTHAPRLFLAVCALSLICPGFPSAAHAQPTLLIELDALGYNDGDSVSLGTKIEWAIRVSWDNLPWSTPTILNLAEWKISSSTKTGFQLPTLGPDAAMRPGIVLDLLGTAVVTCASVDNISYFNANLVGVFQADPQPFDFLRIITTTSEIGSLSLAVDRKTRPGTTAMTVLATTDPSIPFSTRYFWFQNAASPGVTITSEQINVIPSPGVLCLAALALPLHRRRTR